MKPPSEVTVPSLLLCPLSDIESLFPLLPLPPPVDSPDTLKAAKSFLISILDRLGCGRVPLIVSLRSVVRVTVTVATAAGGLLVRLEEAASFVDALRRNEGEVSSEERVEVAFDTEGLRSEPRWGGVVSSSTCRRNGDGVPGESPPRFSAWSRLDCLLAWVISTVAWVGEPSLAEDVRVEVAREALDSFGLPPDRDLMGMDNGWVVFDGVTVARVGTMPALDLRSMGGVTGVLVEREAWVEEGLCLNEDGWLMLSRTVLISGGTAIWWTTETAGQSAGGINRTSEVVLGGRQQPGQPGF